MKRLLTLAGLLAVAVATYGNHRRNRGRQDNLGRPDTPAAPLADDAERSPVKPFIRNATLPGRPIAESPGTAP